jgi:S-layer homology domain
MKKKSPSQSAFFNPRALIGLSVCLAGMLIAFFAFGVPLERTDQPVNQPQLDSNTMTRGELAGLYGPLAVAAFTPPACVAGSEMFADVSADNPFCPWIEELARRGITTGCTPTMYCPNAAVTRAQMAVFLIRAVEAAKPVQRVLFNTTAVAANTNFSIFSPVCPAGERAASGGHRATQFQAPDNLAASRPSNGGFLDVSGVNVADRWLVQGHNGAIAQNYVAYVVCVPISGN